MRREGDEVRRRERCINQQEILSARRERGGGKREKGEGGRKGERGRKEQS